VIYAPNLYSGNLFTTPIVLNDDIATYQFTQDQFLNNLTVPAQGEILLLDNFRIKPPPYTPSPFAYVKIHKIDNNNNNNGVALGQATRLRIKFTILNNYRLIGDIVETTEYLTYYLYKVQLLDFIYFNEANNYIKDYSVSASIVNSFTTTIPANPPLNLLPTASINVLNYYNSSSGYTTFQNTPNVRLLTTSSITIDNTSGTTPLFFLSYSTTSDFSSIIASLPAFVTLPLGVSTYTISGSFIPLNGDSYVLTSISIPPTNLTIQNVQFQLTQSNNWSISTSPTAPVSCSIIIEPYITENNFFYNSDNNVLLNSVNNQRENSYALDVDYTAGILPPINFNALINGTAIPATVPDSNYTSKKSTLLKYDGSKSTSKLLNQWTQGDIGTYGKLPTVESLKTYIAYCDNDTFGGLSGWPPEHENASAMFIKYLIKSDGTVVIPNTSKDSLSIMQQTFLTGERVIISSAGGTPLNPYRTVIRGGSHIEPILYTQSGSAPNAKFSGSILLQDIDLTNGAATSDESQDYRANPNTGTSISNFDPINLPLFYSTNQNNVPISTDSSYGFGYTVQSSTVNDGCNLIFTPIFRVSNISSFPGLTFKISLRKSTTPGSGISILVDSLTTDGYYPQFNTYGGPPQREYKAVFTVPSSDLEVNTIYFIEIQITSLGPYATFTGGSPFINHNTYGVRLKVTQYPTLITPFSSTGYNTIWGYLDKTTYPYIITSSKQQLTDNYGNPEIRMKSVEGTGFNQIQLPWSIKIGDEFRFEGREDWTYLVKNIFGPAESGSGRISQTGSIEVHFNANLPVSASSTVFNLDHFLIRRYVDDAAQNVITGFRPQGSTSPYLIKPEFVVPELNKNIDEVILDLTQKGLIT
jgi:hypothetical protein